MEIPSKLLEQTASKTRPKNEENLLIVEDKSDNEKHLSQPFQTKIKQFKISITFLTGSIGISNSTNKNREF